MLPRNFRFLPTAMSEVLELPQGWLEAPCLTGESVERLPPMDSTNIERASQEFCESLLFAAKQCIPHGCRKNYVPSWDKECETLCRSLIWAPMRTDSDRSASSFFSENRRNRSDGEKLSIPLTSRTLIAKRGVPSTNLLAGLDAPLACALSQQTPSPHNLWRTGPGATSLPGLSTRSCPTHGRSQYLWPFQARGACCCPQVPEGKPLGLDSIFPEFILHAGSALKSGFCGFLTSCMHQIKILKIWRRALMVVIPKLEKPLGDPKSYCPIFLHCVPFKILERLIYTFVEPIIDHCSHKDRWAFDTWGRPQTRSPCWHSTSRIAFQLRRPELCLSISQQAMTLYGIAASPASCGNCHLIDTWSTWSWRWLVITASHLPPEMANIAGSKLATQNGVPQRFVPFSSTSTCLTCQMPNIVCRKYAYADDLAIMHADWDWQAGKGCWARTWQP